MNHHQINVQGMNCNHCAQVVEQQLTNIKDVTAKVSLETQSVDVKAPEHISLTELQQVIQTAGFETI